MDKKLRKLVETSNRLGEMPVFADSLDIKGTAIIKNPLMKIIS